MHIFTSAHMSHLTQPDESEESVRQRTTASTPKINSTNDAALFSDDEGATVKPTKAASAEVDARGMNESQAGAGGASLTPLVLSAFYNFMQFMKLLIWWLIWIGGWGCWIGIVLLTAGAVLGSILYVCLLALGAAIVVACFVAKLFLGVLGMRIVRIIGCYSQTLCLYGATLVGVLVDEACCA
jgi:hypothetical protein